MTTTDQLTSTDPVEELAGRVFSSGVAALELTTVYLGQQLGLYQVLADHGPVTAARLAELAGIDARYAREWLQAQALTGYVTADQPDLERARFTLVPGGREVFVDVLSPTYLAPLAQAVAATTRVLPDLVEAYRTGAGLPYGAYGPDAVDAQGALNRPAFAHELVSAWIPAMPSVAERLAHGDTRVADIGCGVGWSTIALAEGYPDLRIDGFDSDPASIERARHNAAEHKVADRVTFELADMGEASRPGTYDVEFMFECLHDLSHPDQVLRIAKANLKPDGELVVMDERTDETAIMPSDDPVQRFFGAVSAVWCLPQGRTTPDAHPIGTVIRPDDLREAATDAGFGSIEIAPVDHPVFRFYRLTR